MWGSETDMMIGYHSVPVIADAYLKGLIGFDAEKALTACIATANDDNYRGIGLYKKNGFIPYDVIDSYNADNWAMSRTLEYAFDDYCISLIAKTIGNDSVAEVFTSRSKNYKNLYNPITSFMQPRNKNGDFQPDFNPDDYTPHICESNAWHYFWSVPHDIDGLIKLVGEKRFVQKLDSMFAYNPSEDDDLPIFSTGMIGQYAHGNEPSHHVAYLYNAVRKPWETQRLVTRIMKDFYKNSPDGLCGNEDCGQMSAWYVFSAMGFYPINPVSQRYEIGMPLFDNIKLHLENGKTFEVVVKNRSESNCYIKQVWINGKEYHCSYLTHEQIVSGVCVEFILGDEPVCWY
jgi:predicted alpha-1,2-mannosidase